MTLTVDAVVVGAGINGLVASAELARSGWSVALVEGNDRLGGFIASEERTLPGYVHDTYSSWHPLFVSGPAYAELGGDLERLGLRYCNTDGPVTASVADGGRVTVAHRDPEQTAAGFADAADRQTYLDALHRFLQHAAPVGGLMGSELRSLRALRHIGSLVASGRVTGTELWLRDLAASGRAWCRREFRGPEVDQLWVPWLLHAGLSPDNASGGFMIPVLAATVHGFGLPVVAGGAGAFVDAFTRLLDELSVHVLTGVDVDRILVEDGRAVGVVAGGTTVRAERAVLASVSPQALYGELLPSEVVPSDVAHQARQYRYGRGEMQVHVALSAPLKWSDPRLEGVPLVHVSDGSSSTGIACAEAEADLLPRRPTVVVGQQHLLDAGRVPDGRGALWLQLQEVPFTPRGDAAAELDVSAGWSPDLARAFAERVLARVAQHAPGLLDHVLALDVVTPQDLLAHNPNAVAGDPYGGSAELDQNFLWRPLPAASRHRTTVPGLWHIGAATHPGPGLGAGSGHLVAKLLTTTPKVRRRAGAAAADVRRSVQWMRRR